MKRCSSCHAEKPESDFYRNRAQPDGLTNQCKVCHGAARARFMATERGREVARQNTRRYRAAHPERLAPWDAYKGKARNAVVYAVQTGVLTKPPACDCCGSRRVLQAHHHRGYEPEHHLDVVWLCTRCHGFAHRRKNPAT